MAFAIDVILKYLPVVDSALARRACICQHKPAVQLFRGNGERLAMNAVHIKMDGAYTAIESGIVVLASSRHSNELGFNILRHHPDLLPVQLASGVAREGRSHGNHER